MYHTVPVGGLCDGVAPGSLVCLLDNYPNRDQTSVRKGVGRAIQEAFNAKLSSLSLGAKLPCVEALKAHWHYAVDKIPDR